jgi:hypothetical protein
MARAERCSQASADRGESMAGTASVVRSWLLLEHPGPWGQDAFVGGRLSAGLVPELSHRCRAAGVRPLFIRRVDGRVAGSSARCFAIRSGPEPPTIETAALERLHDALDLDIEALGRGSKLGLDAHDDHVFLVCTHGRHDRCCAERGRPLARVLATAFASQTWESSHFGGDRFAGNVIAFPHGLYFGRVSPADAASVARAYIDGRLALEHLRGRSCYAMPVQAAEYELRVAHSLTGIDDVRFDGSSRAGTDVVARFGTPGGTFAVHLEVRDAEPQYLTCRSESPDAAPHYRLVDLRRVE